MKVKSILLAAAVAIISANCKEKTEQSSEIETTVTETVSSEASHDMNHTDGASPMMAAMQKMLDKMHQMEKTGNADYDLAASMKEHHQGAIDMAAVEINSGTDPMLKSMAQKMTEMQQREIAELEGIMAQSKSGAKNYDEHGLGKVMMDNMMSMMKMPETAGSVDQDFAIMMVKHHSDGIMKGQAILKYAKNAKFKSMTEKMIAHQSKDIKELESWLASH